MAGLDSRVRRLVPNMAQWTVRGDHNFGGTVDSTTVRMLLPTLTLFRFYNILVTGGGGGGGGGSFASQTLTLRSV